MPRFRRFPRLFRPAVALVPMVVMVGAVFGLTAQGPASASLPSIPLIPGNLLVATSVYQNDPNIVAGVTQLPPECGSKASPCVTAVANGNYPTVFNNASVDGSFGVTSKIELNELTPFGFPLGSIEVPNSSQPGITASSDQLVTSFSSKSELALNLSTDGKFVTFMGYNAAVDSADVSNANTPGDIDPTSADVGPFFRVVGELGQDGTFHFTETNAFSGDNGRAAVLNDESGADLFYAAGNAGNGANPEPNGVVTGAGAQLIQPSSAPESAQTPPQPTPVGSFNINQLGDAVDKSAKDDNYRGLTVYNNVLYYTKGSGGNGVDTVYYVNNSMQSCPSGSGLPTAGASLPTTSAFTVNNFGTAKKADPGLTPENMCILKGFPTNLVPSGATADDNDFPFGIWFANPHTLYVADEGAGDNTFSTSSGTFTAAAVSTTAGLQKWVFNTSTGSWNLAYTLQSGLNLGQPYTVPGYPTGDNTGPGGTGLPWAPATDGLRNITGQVNPDGTVTIWAETSTVSGSGDQGADPNKLVAITDNLGAQTLPTNEHFQTVMDAKNGVVVRGVSFTPGTGVGRPGLTLCTGNTYTDTTLGDVIVPFGSSCTLTDVTVTGSVVVQNGATLVDNDSSIQGNLQSSGAAGVDVLGGQIGGNLQVLGTTGIPKIGDASTVNDLCGASIGVDVQVQRSGSGAPFDIGAAPDCAAPLTIGGNLQIQDNAGAVAVGHAQNGLGNTVHGNIEVQNNVGGGSLQDNSAGGSCQLSGDTPGIAGSGNTATGTNTCNTTA